MSLLLDCRRVLVVFLPLATGGCPPWCLVYSRSRSSLVETGNETLTNLPLSRHRVISITHTHYICPRSPPPVFLSPSSVFLAQFSFVPDLSLLRTMLWFMCIFNPKCFYKYSIFLRSCHLSSIVIQILLRINEAGLTEKHPNEALIVSCLSTLLGIKEAGLIYKYTNEALIVSCLLKYQPVTSAALTEN